MVSRKTQLGVFGDGEDLAGREAVQPDLGEALLDAGKEALKPVDLEVGMDAALHEHAGAAELQRLGNLLVDFFKFEDVAFAGAGPFERAIKGAEGTVFRAELV